MYNRVRLLNILHCVLEGTMSGSCVGALGTELYYSQLGLWLEWPEDELFVRHFLRAVVQTAVE